MTILPDEPQFVEYGSKAAKLKEDLSNLIAQQELLSNKKIKLIRHIEVLDELTNKYKDEYLALCACIGKGLVVNVHNQYCLYDLDYENPTDYSPYNLKK